MKREVGIAWTQAYMCSGLLYLVDTVRSQELDEEPEAQASLLVTNDTFGVGCVISFVCLRGLHPFPHGSKNINIPSNIRAHR